MTIEEKIEFIKRQLKEIRELDQGFSLFGASRHQYRLNPTLQEHEVSAFEGRFNIHLPDDYRSFLLLAGNGGAGPYYGMESFESGLLDDLDFRKKPTFINPAVPFPFNEAWDMEYAGDVSSIPDRQAFDKEYFDSKWASGLLRICNFGCGVSINLVVNGAEYGHIWVDDRNNDNGIYPDPYFDQPGRTTFLQWYMLWLDKSMNTLTEKPTS